MTKLRRRSQVDLLNTVENSKKDRVSDEQVRRGHSYDRRLSNDHEGCPNRVPETIVQLAV